MNSPKRLPEVKKSGRLNDLPPHQCSLVFSCSLVPITHIYRTINKVIHTHFVFLTVLVNGTELSVKRTGTQVKTIRFLEGGQASPKRA